LSVCDDLFDPNRELGFYDPVSDMSVPLEMDSVAVLKTRVPSINEVHSCPHIVMTSDAEWDPKSFSGCMLTQEEKEQMHITAGVKVSDVNIDAYPNQPQFISDTSESDVMLASVLSALCDQTMLPRLISKIQVATHICDDDVQLAEMNLHGVRVASVSATFSKTRHSKVNAEELSRRWQIGLQMARDTLKMMTQFGI
jgi:hypothetical protein